MDKYKVRLTFMELLLGTTPLDPEVYSKWVAAQAAPQAEDEELETLPELEDLLEAGTTGFHREDGKPFLYDYVIKGFFKDACGMLRRVPDTGSSKIRAYKKIIDGLVFPSPRRILIDLNGGEEGIREPVADGPGIGNRGMGILERPLRAQTARGERVTLARSETCPPGSTIAFRLLILGQIDEAQLREWLEYGALRGLGQWRNSGMGRFTYELEAVQ